MNLLEGARIALESLRTNKLRTFLTLLGNIVGTMSVIAVVSLINGIDTYARQKVLDEGSDVFSVTRVNPLEFLTDFDEFLRSLSNPDLTLADRDWLASRLPAARAVGGAISASGELRAGKRTFRHCRVRGRTEDYPLFEEMPLASGRHLTEQDVRQSRPVALLGWEVARDLFPGVNDPAGRSVKLGRRHFDVIGVVADRGTVLGENRNQFVVVPLTTYQKVFGARESIDIRVAAGDVRRIEEVKDEVRFLMRVRHRLRPLAKDDFAVQTPDQLLRIWKGISSAIYSALTPLVGISLVIGGIVLMNIMLIAVTERTREIGVRKALGATRKAVLWQFLVEAMTLSVVGGILGVSLGFGLAGLVALLSPLPFAFAAWAIVLGLVVTLLIGLFFGTYPAWKAARLDPVEALRHE